MKERRKEGKKRNEGRRERKREGKEEGRGGDLPDVDALLVDLADI